MDTGGRHARWRPRDNRKADAGPRHCWPATAKSMWC